MASTFASVLAVVDGAFYLETCGHAGAARVEAAPKAKVGLPHSSSPPPPNVTLGASLFFSKHHHVGTCHQAEFYARGHA